MMRSLLLLLVLAPAFLGAQSKRGPNYNQRAKQGIQAKFLEKQWWLGFKAGSNVTRANPTQRYAILTPTNYDPALNHKVYESFTEFGFQATVEASFFYKGFLFSAQPTYRQSSFAYSNQFEWDNPENSTDRLLLKYNQLQRLDFLDLPFIVKYEVGGNKLRPYVQAGVFYSLLLNGTKEVVVSGTDFASGGTNSFQNEALIIGAKDLFDNYWGALAGAGVNYSLGNVRLTLDASYRMGQSNIANIANRFSNDRLNGIGDAQDDLKINNIVVSLGCLFPLRFLASSFKSVD